jgi:hypothetical protein
MTSETRVTINLSDVRALDFICRSCSGTVGLNPNWRKVLIIPTSCPTCGEKWLTQGSDMYKAIEGLIGSLRAIPEMEKGNEFKFELRINVPRQISDRAADKTD